MTMMERMSNRAREAMRWSVIRSALQWTVSATSTLVLFFVMLKFLHAAEPLSGTGASFIASFDSTIIWIEQTVLVPLLPSVTHSEAVFLFMLLCLILTMAGVARDRRVLFMSLIVFVSAIAMFVFLPSDINPNETAISAGSTARKTIYWVIFAPTLIALALTAFSFRRKRVRKLLIRSDSRLRQRLLIFYWFFVFIICLFQFLFLSNDPDAVAGETSTTVLTIALLAILLVLGIYLISSGLIILQTLLWRAAIEPSESFDPNIWQLLRDPFPTFYDDPGFPASGTATVLLLVWLACSISALVGSLSTAKLARRYAAAIGGACLVTVVSIGLPKFGAALLHMISF